MDNQVPGQYPPVTQDILPKPLPNSDLQIQSSLASSVTALQNNTTNLTNITPINSGLHLQNQNQLSQGQRINNALLDVAMSQQQFTVNDQRGRRRSSGENYSSTTARPSNNASKTSKKIACTECRQQKAKCDAFEKAPGPCSRCIKRGIECRMNSDYKRTFKRAKIAQMEKEYEQLRMKLAYESNPSSVSTSPKQLQNPQLHHPQPTPQHIEPILQRNTTNSPSYLPPISSLSPAPVSFSGQPIKRYLSSPPPFPGSTTPPGPLPTQLKTDFRGIPSSLPGPLSQYSSSSSQFIESPQTFQLNPPKPPDNQFPFSLQQQQQYVGPSVVRVATAEHTLFGSKMPEPRPVPKVIIEDSLAECTPKSMGGITLDSNQIKNLFTDFVASYHPMLPIVDISKGIEKIYRLCPVLFWTIMFTALRRHRSASFSKYEAQKLYFPLSAVLKSALANLAISPITRYVPSELEEPFLNVSSVYSVQALLLYTFWPPITSSLSADTSWNSIGLAIFQAIRIGLHLPGHSSDGIKKISKDLLKEQTRTWIGCNIVSQVVATAFGFPGFTQLDTALLVSCKPENGLDVPPELRQMVEIQLFEDQVARTLNNNPLDPLRLVDASERLPLLHLLNNELDQLEMSLSTDFQYPLDDFRRLSLLAARLHLFTYTFLDTERIATFELNKGRVKSYNAALALIVHCREAQTREKYFVKHLPGMYVLTIWQASCIIIKLLHSPDASYLDVGAGKQLYEDAMNLVYKASITKHDMAYRSAGIMKSAWSLFKTLNDQNAKITVRSRMCASVFFDCLWTLREKCGMIKLAPKKKELQLIEEAVADSDDSDADYVESNPSDSDEAFIPLENQEIHPSNNGSPTSISSTHSKDSHHKKKYRSLSDSLHPESSARKIISTIPLDPEPISLSDAQNQSTPSNSNKASPFVSYKSPPSDFSRKPLIGTPKQEKSSTASVKPKTKTNKKQRSARTKKYSKPEKTLKKSTVNTGPSSAPVGSVLDSFDLLNDIDSDLLFKDIDTVMNDFGFHAG